MRVTVKIKIADSVEAEEAAGRTGQPLPREITVSLLGDEVDMDEVEELVYEELSGLGFGGLEFEILDYGV